MLPQPERSAELADGSLNSQPRVLHRAQLCFSYTALACGLLGVLGDVRDVGQVRMGRLNALRECGRAGYPAGWCTVQLFIYFSFTAFPKRTLLFLSSSFHLPFLFRCFGSALQKNRGPVFGVISVSLKRRVGDTKALRMRVQ